MRTRGVRYWLAAAGLLGFVLLYVAPMIQAFRLPAYVAPLPTVETPRVWFPSLALPKLRTPPVVRDVPPQRTPASTPAPATSARRQRTIRHRLPVVTDRYSLVAPSAPSAPS